MSAFEPGTPAADVLDCLQRLAAQARPPDGPPPGDAPFLSVLVRTQGTRPATLEDTLLSLAAQTCDDFEVLVLVHDPDDGVVAGIQGTVGTFHRRFADRVRVLTVHGGGRSRPLNEGAAQARGRYLAMLDDDDLAFAHWVASFKAAAERAPGHVVRACVATQLVRALPVAWEGAEGEEKGYEVVGRPHVDYPIAFDFLEHLVDNRTPSNGYAVPRVAVCGLGLTWDESLPVLEDWDHLMRTATICGVESAATVSALLRAWEGAANSKTAHAEEIWKTTHRRIEERLDALPVILPRGATVTLRARAEDGGGRRSRLEAEVRRLTRSLEEADRRLVAVDDDVAALRHALADAQAQLAAVWSSTTWRVARAAQAPLAVARRVAGSVRTGRNGNGGS